MGPALIFFIILTLLPSLASGQSLPKVRMAYTSINIQMTPIYMMKELDLPRKQGLDVEILYIPVSSRAVQAALAGEIHTNINANMAGADFVGITATLNTFAFKIIGQPGLREPKNLKGKKIGISAWVAPAIFALVSRSIVGGWFQIKTSPLSKSVANRS
jgi:ABC-type nitrate/sulfonate/bicarbonate transport system substrate-binding protein